MGDELLEQSLGQLACAIPGATRIFHHYHLDFCCDGTSALREAAEAKGLDALGIALQLLRCQQEQLPGSDWREAPTGELIEHILARYHQRHREQLPELIRLAQRVEHVHLDKANCPHGLTEFLHELREELELHMQKEEQILFPMLRHGSGLAHGPIGMMRYEHDQHAAALAQLGQLTNQMQAPQGACNTWQALYRGLAELRDDLMEHIHLENNVLFTRH
jgi:regulator of cell morphogenesis and NO signaling